MTSRASHNAVLVVPGDESGGEEVWVDAPVGEPWEIYTVLADVEMPPGQLRAVESAEDAMCCASAPETAARCCS
jgi:hypothetical protein